MSSISKTYEIKAPIEKVWDALTNPETINKWGAGPNVKMSEEVGSEFELWDKTIWGTNTEVIPNKKLVQDWFGGKWDKPSIVTFELSEKDGITTVELTNTDMPDHEKEDFAKGWDEEYMNPLKKLVESE